MRTDGRTVRGNELDMGKVKALVKRTFSRERISLGISKLVVGGYVGVMLAQVLQTY